MSGQSTCSSTEVASFSKTANKPRRSAQVSEPSDNERTNTTVEEDKPAESAVGEKAAADHELLVAGENGTLLSLLEVVMYSWTISEVIRDICRILIRS